MTFAPGLSHTISTTSAFSRPSAQACANASKLVPDPLAKMAIFFLLFIYKNVINRLFSV